MIKKAFRTNNAEFVGLIFSKEIQRPLLCKNKEKLLEEIFLQIHMLIFSFDFKQQLNFKQCKAHLQKNFERFSFGLVLTDFIDSLGDSITHCGDLRVNSIMARRDTII